MTGHLVLVGRKAEGAERGITDQDLFVMLRIVQEAESISFSLDPWDPSCPDNTGNGFQKVFYPDMLAKTALGQTLLRTDYDMKKLAFGLLPLRSCPEFMSELRLSVREGHASGDEKSQVRARLWIEPEHAPLEASAPDYFGRILALGDVRTKCCSRELVLDPTKPSGLRDADHGKESGTSAEFAAQFSRCFPQLAQEYPEYDRLKDCLKLLRLCGWPTLVLKQRGMCSGRFCSTTALTRLRRHSAAGAQRRCPSMVTLTRQCLDSAMLHRAQTASARSRVASCSTPFVG